MIGDIYSVKGHSGFLAIWSPARRNGFDAGVALMQVVVEGTHHEGVVLPEGAVYPESAATLLPIMYFSARSKKNLVLVGKLDARYLCFVPCAANIVTFSPTEYMTRLFAEIFKMDWY